MTTDEFKVAICGSGGCGKSALMFQFLQNLFNSVTDPTIIDIFGTQIIVDEKLSFVEVIETPLFLIGQDEYKGMREKSLKEMNGFILMFSIVDEQSFVEVKSHYEEILRVVRKKCPMVLVGNKSDLGGQRVVDTARATMFAQELDIPYVESSAKQAVNVDTVFETMVRQIRNERNEKNQSKNCELM